MNKQENLQSILKHEYFKDFVKQNNFSDEDLLDNYFVFEDAYNSILKCKNCKGLETCHQKKKGQFVGIEYTGVFNNNVNYCKYYQEKKKCLDLINSYVYYDIANELCELSLDNIECPDKDLKQLFVLAYNLYENKTKKGLYIYGDLGVGKTYLCVALANSLVAKGKKVAFIKTNDFVTKMSELIREKAYEYENLVKKIQKADVVFFDDIGSEVVSEFSRDRLLFNILDYRMENKLTTIFTSNLDKNGLQKHFSNNQDDSLKASRLTERIDVLSDNVLIKGKDKRRV